MKDLHENNPWQLHVVHLSGKGEQNNFYTILLFTFRKTNGDS